MGIEEAKSISPLRWLAIFVEVNPIVTTSRSTLNRSAPCGYRPSTALLPPGWARLAWIVIQGNRRGTKLVQDVKHESKQLAHGSLTIP